MKLMQSQEVRGIKRRGIEILVCGRRRPVSAFADKENADANGLTLRPRRWTVGVCAHRRGFQSHALVLAFFLCLISAHAQTSSAPTIDRAAVYQAAQPLYLYAASRPLTVKVTGTQAIGAAKLQRFSYLSTHGQRVPALLFTPPGASAAHPVPCIVILHGLGGSKEIMAGMALSVVKAGDAALVIDEYGQGERGPLKTPAGQEGAALAATVSQSAVDVRRGIDYLATRPDIDSRRVGLAGVSLGAIIGTVACGVEPRLKAAVLVSGGGDWGVILKTLSSRNATVGGRSTAVFKASDWAKLNARLAPVDPLTFAPHIAPRPVLMLGGRKDTTIVPQSQQELYDALNQPKQLVWYPQYGHVPPPEVVYPAMQKFFARAL